MEFRVKNVDAFTLDQIGTLIYLTDMETFDLVFINAFGRDELGLIIPEGGAACYLLMHDLDKPCNLCNHEKLRRDGQMYWEGSSLRNQKRNLMFNRVVWYEGRLCRLEMVVDVTEKERLAYYDGLTGLLNRNRYQEFTESADAAALDQLGVLMVDVNRLKQVNDTEGHAAGDRVLRRVADILKGVFEDSAVFRLGGDEFLVLCQNVSLEEFHSRCALLQRRLSDGEQMLAAFGSAWGAEFEDFGHMVRQADRRMYHQKAKHYRKWGYTLREGNG